MTVPVRIGVEDQPSSAGWELLRFDNNTLHIAKERGATTPLVEVGAQVYVQWLDTVRRVRLEVSGRAVQSGPEGFAVALFRVEAELIQSLLQQFDATEPAPEQARKLDAEAISAQICALISSHFQRQLAGFFQAAYAQSQRANLAAYERTRVEQVYAQLRRSEQQIEQEVCAELMRPFLSQSQLRAQDNSRRGLLKLVDGEELELWLIRSEAAGRLERELRAALEDVQLRLERLSASLTQVDAHSLAPERVINALIRGFKVVELDYTLQQGLLRLAGQAQCLLLAEFYRQLLQLLGAAGIGSSPTDAATNKAARAGFVSDSSAPHARLRAHLSHDGARLSAQALPTVVDPQLVYAATRSLWSYAHRRDAALRGVPLTPNDSSAATDKDLLRAASLLANDEASLRSARNFKSSLSDRVAALSGQKRVQLNERQSEAVELLGRLNEALHHDPLLAPSFRRWSRRLLPALLGTQLGQSDLGNQGELVKQLFALIEFGSVLCEQQPNDPRTSSIREGIDAVVGELAQQSQLDESMVSEACRKLEALLERQRRAGAAVEDRVVETCQGQHRVEQARRYVAKELVVYFGGREIPELLIQLLDEAMRALLELSFLRSGAEGAEWVGDLDLLSHLDNGLRAAASGQPMLQSELLTAQLRARLAHADSARLAQLLSELQAQLNGAPQRLIAYRKDGALAEPMTAVAVIEPAQQALNDQLDLLQPGDWVAFDAAQAEPRLLKLAWLSGDKTRFVFVSQLGRKSADLSRAELQASLQEGRARVLDERGASIIERAWRHMLEGLHNELAEQATHDPLTGLINRKELDRHLLAWVNRPQAAQLGLMWIGVDRLRMLNQSHGMEAGDFCLTQVAVELKRVLETAKGVAARMAGDEFALLLDEVSEGHTLGLAKDLVERLSATTLQWKEHSFRVSISVGVVISDSDRVDPVAVLKDAEAACRAAKDSGRSRAYLHQADDQRLTSMRQTVSWIGRIEQSLKDDSLLLYGQRALSLSDAAKSQPDYLEVLLRMRAGDRIHTPEQFILAAERYGQIAAIDQFVLTRLIEQLGRSKRGHEYRVAFNISARNIVDPDFIERMVRELEQQRFPLQQLCVELTETAAIQQLALAQRGMQRLHDVGLAMVLDDFGSGWSSYQYLKRLPVDIVKVDGAFIREISSSEQDLALARSINEIAHLMGKQTVAEHVEDQATLNLVREIGFDYAQGFFVGRPEPLSQLL